MNKRERKALEIYERNKNIPESEFQRMSTDELCLRAKQQDKLYTLAYGRMDRDFFNRVQADG